MAPKKDDKSLIEKAKSHKVARQSKTPITVEELKVYVAYINGEIDISQACYGLDMSPATFRGNSGSVIREAIVQERITETDFVE